jgi:predicted phage terminase large subunit-like protein
VSANAKQQEELLRAARRMLAVKKAADNLLDFMRLTMPDPEDIEDVSRSRYEVTPQARLLCQIVEKVQQRKLKRVCISIGPQLGKSQILSRGGPAWMLGKDPYLNVILGTYNQPFANEFGDAVREIMNSPAYAQVFPRVSLRKGGQAKDLLITEAGGRAAFVGRGGSGTGKPADVFLVDDPLKDAIEAQSDATRDEVWEWFNKVALTRCHERSAILVVHTRWNQDDLIGRLADPDHPERHGKYAGIADRWTYINLPAVIEDPKLAAALGLTLTEPTDPFVRKMFGVKPMSALWPGRKGLEFLAEAKQQDASGFGALYMGQPSPADGDYFKASDLVEYNVDDLPEELTIYGASDHAVGLKQRNDSTVLGCVGVDAQDDIWVLPSLVWGKLPTDRIVEELLAQFRNHKPETWWMESELISKSFGPFLLKRMAEERLYTPIEPVIVSKDKLSRARSIQGRTQMRKVRFPRFAPWWEAAKRQMLMFPNGANDDFVDWLAHIGLGLLKQVAPEEGNVQNVKESARTGSVEWHLQRTLLRVQSEPAKKQAVGW